jgi:hypothetical protein
MLLTIFIVLMVVWLVSLTPPAAPFAPYAGWVAFRGERATYLRDRVRSLPHSMHDHRVLPGDGRLCLALCLAIC